MTVLEMSLSAAVLIFAIVIIRAPAIHRLPKKTFLVLWGVALCRLLIPLSIPSRLSVYTLADMLKNKASRMDTPYIATAIPELVTAAVRAESPSLTDTAIVTLSPVTALWMTGLLACALFFLVTHLRCRREYRTALPIDNELVRQWLSEHPIRRRVQIRQLDKIAAPLTYGIFRPVVLLPKATDWTDETRLRYILAHEFVHIRRLDTLTKLLLAAALCLHWFNPFVWAMYVLANRDIELSCDEMVVRTFGEAIKSAYALTLVGLEEKKSGLTPLVNNFSKNAIEERIVFIMKIKKTSLAGSLLAVALVFGTTAIFATNAASAPEINAPITNEDFDSRDISRILNPIQREAISADSSSGASTDRSSAAQKSSSGTQGSAPPIAYSSEGMITPDELAKVYAVYERFGLTYDKKQDCLYYNGKLVREFMDILSSNGEALESGKFKGSMRQFGSTDGKGEVDIKAVRDYTKLNADGEGELIGIEVVK